MELNDVKKYGAICLLSFSPMFLRAQSVIIDGELRPRTEYRDGYGAPNADGTDPGVFTIQRTRLGMTYTSGLLNAQITVQDARTYGQFANASSDATTGLYEAWGEMLLVPGGSLKVGRQALKYDDNRLFAASDWSNTGTSHDLALFKYGLNDFQANIGLAYNNSSAISTETYYSSTVKYRYMGLLWLSKDLFKGLNLSALLVDEGVQDTLSTGLKKYKKITMNHTYTFGGNLKYQSPDAKWKVLGTAYFQAGKNSTGSEMAGSMLAIKANYAISKIFSANLGTDYYSGDDNTSDSKQYNFKKLYGSDHSFNGSMGYWSTPLTQGLLDYYGGVTSKVSDKTSLEGAYHVFDTDKKLSSGGKDIGSELDLIINQKINPITTMQVGWSAYFKTDNLLVAKKITAGTKVRFPQWAYVMLTIKPVFLNMSSVNK
jgi:hypothetical protein